MVDAFHLQKSRNSVLVVSFTFHEGQPEGLNFHFDVGIFHDPKHLLLQAATGWRTFCIRHGEFVEGIMQVNIQSGEAISPYRSPFGSFLFSDSVDQLTQREFIRYCESKLKEVKADGIRLKHQPELYHPGKNRLLETLLINEGYTTAAEETSAIIFITDESFESGLHRSEKKRLRKCRDSNLLFDVVSTDQLQSIYAFLETCRKEKGYSLSMAFPEIEALARTFPDRLVLTRVTDNGRIVAANISIRVYNDVLYNFYHDHSGEYDHLSPVVLVNEGLYQYCQHRQIRLLDLGTSNLDGNVNESLLNFKLRLGGHASRKLTFTKRFV